MPKHSYGWVPDLPDQRDFMYSAPVENMAALPPSEDLRPKCPKEVYDQGQLGSCTANSIAGALEFEQISVGNIGACPETDWAYDITKFAVKPPPKAFSDAPLGKVLQYQRVPQVLNQMKGCLASGYPFVFGFTVYESFESPQVAQTGVAPMPAAGEKVLGGHAVLAVGYDDASQRFIIRNSWGAGWGMGGYFTFPYAYLTDANLSDDFWTVRLVAKAAAGPAMHKTHAAAKH